MIFNFSKKQRFTTRLIADDENIEVIKDIKLLGTIITDDLKWDANTQYIVKKNHGNECNCSTLQLSLQKKEMT